MYPPPRGKSSVALSKVRAPSNSVVGLILLIGLQTGCQRTIPSSSANNWQPDWATAPDKSKKPKTQLSPTVTFSDDWLGAVPVLDTDEQRKANDRDIRAKELFTQAFRRSSECKGVTFKRTRPRAADFDVQIFDGIDGRTGKWQWVLYRTDTAERLVFGEEADVNLAAKSVCAALRATLEPMGGNVE
jgi:hypothetical protein